MNLVQAARRRAGADQFPTVGWVDGHRREALVGEPHRFFEDFMVGLAPLDPPYGLHPFPNSITDQPGVPGRALEEDIAFFSVLAEIEPFDLGLAGNPQAHHGIEDLEDDEGAGDGQPPGDHGGQDLALPERPPLD